MAETFTAFCDRMEGMGNEALLQQLRSMFPPACGCNKHEEVWERYGGDRWTDDHREVVHAILSRRGLSVLMESDEPKPQCPTCDRTYELGDTLSAETGPDVFLVCTNCNTMQALGDHMNCALGPVQPLPPTTVAASAAVL